MLSGEGDHQIVKAVETVENAGVQADIIRPPLGRLLTTGPQRRDNAWVLFGHVHSIEKAMLDTLREKEPEPDTG